MTLTRPLYHLSNIYYFIDVLDLTLYSLIKQLNRDAKSSGTIEGVNSFSQGLNLPCPTPDFITCDLHNSIVCVNVYDLTFIIPILVVAVM